MAHIAFRRSLAFGAVVASLLAAANAHGQVTAVAAIPNPSATGPDAVPSGQTESGEIIVTAQKRAEKALDVPASLTILTAADLQRGGPVTTMNLTFATPGLKMDRSGVYTTPALRGITSLVSGPGLDPNVATYVDGVYISNAALLLDLPDVDGIAVLKGPQGTLFGRNATGGAIQVTTAKPSFAWKGSASASYGNLDDVAFKGFVSGPIVEDKVAASIAAYSETNDGYLRDVIGGKRFGPLRTRLVRGKVLIKPTDNAELTLSGYYIYRRDPAVAAGTALGGSSIANLQPGAVVPGTPYDVAFDGSGPDGRSKSHGFSLNGVVHTDPGTFTLIAAYADGRSHVLTQNDYGYAPAGGSFYRITQIDKSYTVELDFASRQYENFNYIAGLYYYHDNGNYSPLVVVSTFPAASNLSIFGYQTDTAYAAFGEVNVKPFGRLTITGGVRYSWEKRGLDGLGVSGDVAAPPTQPNDLGNKVYSAWTPRVSLRYALSGRSNLYFTFGQGFKSGGYNATSVFSAPAVPVAPERITAYEVGIKASPSRDVTGSIAAFYYDYKNQQVAAIENVNGVQLQTSNNAAASTIYGAEFEGSARLTEDLRLRASLSWLHARFDRYPGAVAQVPAFAVVDGVFRPVGNSTISVDAAGRTLPRSPSLTFSFGGTYGFDTTAGRVTLTADYFHSSKLYYDPANFYSKSAYANLDASIAVDLAGTGLALTAWGKNLTNAKVPLGTFIATNATAYNWAPPRTYGISAAARF